MRDLPPQQTKILHFFADAEDEGRQLSRAEVAQAFGYAFPSAVSKHVEALVRKGLFQADRDKKRNVRLTETGWAAIGRVPAHRGVPVLGSIAAGVPIMAVENQSGFIQDIKPHPGRFALKVRGDSMIDDGILDGDYAVIQADAKVPDGGIGAVVVDGDATLKHVHVHKDRIELVPANAKYKPLVISKASAATVQVVGPLCFVFRSFT
jgi:repressor LexA